MGFRDDDTALRARLDALERDHAIAERRLAELEPVEKERARLAARVAELEKQTEAARAKRRATAAQLVVPAVLLVGAGVGGLYLVARPEAPALPPTPSSEPGAEAVAPAGLALDGAPSLGMIDLDATPQPAAIPGVASGTLHAPDGCPGYLPAAPQLVLRATGRTATRIAPVGDGTDLVLYVRMPDGTSVCDDDSGGSLSPLVSAMLPAGDTRIWIGTYGGGAITGRYRLEIEARPEAALAPAAAAPTLGTHESGFGRWEGTFEPFEPAPRLDPACRGFVPVREQLVLALDEPAAVRIDASGDADLTLTVRSPDGSVHCDDDSGPGNHPRIAAVLPPGEHRVLVGTFSASSGTIPFALEARAHRLDAHPAPLLGTRALARGEELRVESISSDDVAPAALGAGCTGGLVGLVPHLVVDTGGRAEVLMTLETPARPFVVVVHADRTVECVREPHLRRSWPGGSHAIHVGVADEDAPSGFALGLSSEPPSLVPYRPAGSSGK